MAALVVGLETVQVHGWTTGSSDGFCIGKAW